MIKYTYDHELITMTNMFLNSMSTIIVKRFDVNKQARDQIKARIVYAPKQRVLNDLLDRDQNLKLPVVAVTIGGIARDQNRVFNKILGSFHNLPNFNDKAYHEKTPLPIDITYNVSIMTRYQQDMDQIISNIIPYINPYFTVSWRTPARPDFEIRSNVFWNGNVSIQYPFDLTSTQVARVVAELSFVFKGWMFQAIQDPTGIIYSTHTSFANTQQISEEFVLEDVIRESTDSSDYIEYHGTPPQPEVISPYFTNINESRYFTVWGSGLTEIKNVYLSSENVFNTTTLYDPFSGNPTLSALYPPFSGVKVDSSDWSYNRDNKLTFLMPEAQNIGLANVILEGPYGYGNLTQNVRINQFNPFKPGTEKYETFVPYQLPYINGILVGNISTTDVTFTPELSVTFALELSADSDGDNYTDLVELSAGTDPNDPYDFPTSLFNVFNNI